jgi:hypothetical protein
MMNRLDFKPYQDTPNIGVVADVINYGVNHEIKTIVSDIYVHHAGSLLTAAEVAKTANYLQGPEPAWKLTSKDVIQYSERSLVKSGIVEAGLAMGERGHEVTAWAARATSDDLLVQRAMIGVFSGWGLDTPQISAQKLYRVGGGDQAKAPLIRHRLYDLLWNATADYSIEGLNAIMVKEGHHSRTLGVKLQKLDQEGIVEVRSKQVGNNPLLKVVSSEYHHVAVDFSSTSLETQAAYAASHELGVDTTISVNEFVDEAIKQVPDADPVRLHRYITGSFNEATNHFPGLQLVDRLGMPISDLTAVTLTSDVRQAIGELVTGVNEILAGDNLSKYIKLGRRIMQNPAKVHDLAAKADRFSAVKTGHLHGSAKLTKQMQDILKTGPQTAESMRGELSDRYGRELGRARIHSILNTLIQSGNVSATDQPARPYSAVTRKVYK